MCGLENIPISRLLSQTAIFVWLVLPIYVMRDACPCGYSKNILKSFTEVFAFTMICGGCVYTVNYWHLKINMIWRWELIDVIELTRSFPGVCTTYVFMMFERWNKDLTCLLKLNYFKKKNRNQKALQNSKETLGMWKWRESFISLPEMQISLTYRHFVFVVYVVL